MPQRLYTLFQVADLLGSTLGEVENWIGKGWLECRKMPEGSVRVSEEGLVRFLRSQGIDLSEVMSRIARSEVPGLASAARLDEPVSRPEDVPPPDDGPSVEEVDAARAAHPYGAQARPETWADPGAHPASPGPMALPSEPGPALLDAKQADEGVPPAPLPIGPGPAPDEGPDETAAAGAPPPAAASAPPDVASETPAGEPQARDDDLGEEVAQVRESAAAAEASSAAAEDESEPKEPAAAPADPAAQVIGAVLDDAVRRRASHIHLVSDRDGLSLRLRIDGVLHDKANFRRSLPPGLAPEVMEHVLSMAGLDAGESRRPMRGGFSRTVEDREIAFVVDTTPTVQGRRIVTHVRDPRWSLPVLSQLGLPEADRGRVESLLSAPAGLVMVAGPPRSGRMTTLRAMAMALRDMQRDVVTVERSADVDVPGLCQSVTDRAAGFSCAEAVEALARQHPDVLVVGDLVRPDAMSAAVAAARDGVLVLAAVCASAARATALPTELGADPYDVAATMLAVIEQRLVRRICAACKRVASVPTVLPAGLTQAELNFPVFEPAACDACAHTGYSGRTGLFAVLEMDENVAGAIRRGDSAEIARAAARVGPGALRDAIVQALRDGTTSVTEVRRVLGRP
ncbi:MAG: ATPase, T2SS/T4P/T4SS family [Planctomycetota bacterium]|jgi:type II secretory ATPase GspE/PulE/Tfp pilus assembly ATPase PilB-like protein